MFYLKQHKWTVFFYMLTVILACVCSGATTLLMANFLSHITVGAFMAGLHFLIIAGITTLLGRVNWWLNYYVYFKYSNIIWKEIGTAVVCGAVLAVVCFGKIWLIDKMLLGNESITLMIDAVVCFALFATVFLAKLTGAILPIVAKKLGFDPAVMASPFLTTIVDALSLLVYFLFAGWLLGI